MTTISTINEPDTDRRQPAAPMSVPAIVDNAADQLLARVRKLDWKGGLISRSCRRLSSNSHGWLGCPTCA
ncbi:MAG: hypothetical protein R3C59_17955 [Planctomycetaceae bacterium]